MRVSPTERVGASVRLLILVLLSAGSLFPLYFLIVTALKRDSEFNTNYFLPPLTGVTLDNVGQGLEIVGRFAFNSVQVSLITTVVLLFVIVPAVYAFTWLKFPGAGAIYTVAITTLLVPAVLTFVPQYILTKQLGLLNNQWGVILPFVASGIGLSVYLLRSFFAALPFELVEAARIDGATELQILRRVVLPLSVPSLVTVAVVSIVTTWNAFLWPLVVISSESKRLISVAVTFLAGSTNLPDIPALMGGYLAASLPLIVILSLLLRYFVRGLTEGAVKG